MGRGGARVSQPTDTNIIAVLIGRKLAGKSWRVKYKLLPHIEQWIVWDYRGEYSVLEGARLWASTRDFLHHVEKNPDDLRREVIMGTKRDFTVFCRWCVETGGHWLVLEEIDRHTTGGPAQEALDDLIDRSRHAGVNLICLAHRTAGIPKDLTHQADLIMQAPTSEPGDLEYWRKKAGQDFADKLPHLRQWAFQHWRQG